MARANIRRNQAIGAKGVVHIFPVFFLLHFLQLWKRKAKGTCYFIFNPDSCVFLFFLACDRGQAAERIYLHTDVIKPELDATSDVCGDNLKWVHYVPLPPQPKLTVDDAHLTGTVLCH